MTLSRRRKGRPYDPSKAHDRRAVEFNRGIVSHTTPVEVDDPYEIGGKIVAMRSTRDDPLGDMHARRQIDEAQYQGGRAFQRDFERAERGPQAIDPSKEFVDGGVMPEPITEAQRRAARKLATVYQQLGMNGSALVHDILVHSRTRAQVAASRGLSGRRWEEFFGIRFRECLDTMAVIYGFAQRENRGPKC
jgi:hypothetical protein